MKKAISLILAVILCLPLYGCGKSKAVRAAEDAIAAIGEVTAQSGDAIASAEKLYSILTDSERAKVDNRLTLVDAQESFQKIQGELIYGNAKEAFSQLKDVSVLCIEGMDAIYGA